MGYQHGRTLQQEIKYLERNLGKLFENYERIWGRFALYLFEVLSIILKRNIPQQFQEEIRSIADGSGVSYRFICLINLIEELGEIFYFLKSPFCSCFVARDTPFSQ
ncbi:MAG: hypothetical protein CBR30_06670 [Dictyoglomus sp. NZ13-RE01]|nr:MAG: hypothetical protein CBR30_06670 [Dictyoglomus sp. NZ13-RE01]